MRTLEDAIISESQIFVDNITKLTEMVNTVNDEEVLQLIDKLRRVEKKMSLIFTFFKASVFASNDWDSSDAQAADTNRPAF